jgi:subtilisin family serine protease
MTVWSVLNSPEAMAKKPPRYVPDQLLVQFAPNLITAQAESVAARYGAINVEPLHHPQTQTLTASRMEGWYHVTLGSGVRAAKARRQFAADPAVQRAEFNYTVSLAEVLPNDPMFSELWGLHNRGLGGGTFDADIDAPEAWSTQTCSRDIIVAVNDTGIAHSHPDLAANMWVNPGEIPGNRRDDDGNGFVDDVYGYDFANGDGNPDDDHLHGTHVAGTIGAVGNNGRGVVGVCWRVRLMAVKFLNASGYGSTAGAIKSIQYATAMGAHIMNNSWGGGPFSQALRDAIADANDAGVLFVAAAGNDGRKIDAVPFYPASYDVANVLSVAATDRNDRLAIFSNYGTKNVDLAAPGVAILSTMPGGAYGVLSGTSMAAPHVVGAAALVWSQDLSLDMSNVKALLLNSVDVIPTLSGKVATGGRLNVFNALPRVNDHLVLKNRTITAGEQKTFSATQSIIAGPAFTIEPGAKVRFQAPLIRLVPGFTAKRDSDFSAVTADE